MYSTVGILKTSKLSDKIVGTHQKLDRVSRKILGKNIPKKTFFPSAKDIVHFEGNRGPDGLKVKSAGIDEPAHFIIPKNDDHKLVEIILDHQYNLREALKSGNSVRASFEAAWLAHAITDGLTPAHHFPLVDIREELMTDKEFVKIFGQPIKGIMRGNTPAETARNNWLYWGAGGYMSKHIAFEYGVAVAVTSMPYRLLTPKISRKDFENFDLETEFYKSVHKIDSFHMYDNFCKKGWTAELALEVKEILLPEVVRLVTLAWYSAIPEEQK